MIEFNNRRLLRGIHKMSQAVKKTLGANGEFVFLNHPAIPGGFKVSKDGVSVAMACSSDDHVEELGMKTLRQAAMKTSEVAGDGTSTTIVLADAIISKSLDLVEEDTNKNVLIRELKEKAEKVDRLLKKKSKRITHGRLKKVAYVSSNNNRKIANLVSDLYKTSDRVIFQKSNGGELTTSSIDGLSIDRGYSSKFFVNDYKANECVLENPLILITDTKIDNLQMIEGLLRHVVENNRALLIIGEITQEVLATFNLNVQKGNLKFAHIIPPAMGHSRELLMSDIAAMTYGTYYSEMAGNGIMNLDIDGLGTADKVIVGQAKTIIVPKKLNKEYIDELKAIKDKTAFDEERIDKISGKLNTIHVGASTSVEQNELYDQVEDVVLACKSALEQGVVTGGGVTYKDIAREFTDGSISSQIIRHALLEPINTISDYEGAEDLADGIGYDAIAMDIVDLEKSGILDPAKVAREAFKNAISVATILINTNTVVYESAK